MNQVQEVILKNMQNNYGGNRNYGPAWKYLYFHEREFDSPFPGGISQQSLNPLYPSIDPNTPFYGINNRHYTGPLPVSEGMAYISPTCPLKSHAPNNNSGRVRNI